MCKGLVQLRASRAFMRAEGGDRRPRIHESVERNAVHRVVASTPECRRLVVAGLAFSDVLTEQP